MYGTGYKLARRANASELVIERAAKARYYASFFSTRFPVIAGRAADWPKELTLTFRPEKAAVYSVSKNAPAGKVIVNPPAFDSGSGKPAGDAGAAGMNQ